MRDANPSKRSREMAIYRGTAKLPTARWSAGPVVRLLTDWDYATRAARYLLGMPVPLDTEDRHVLERCIFPHFRSLPQTQRVLFIGCDWYTKHYQKAFFADRDYWTLDVSPKARKFGGTQHIVDGMEQVGRHFAAGSVDLIFCNGVYGFGLDSHDHCERAIEACRASLREGGYFVFGWDDIPARTPVPLETIAALQRFQRLPLEVLGTWRYLTDTPYRHTYDFYRKAG
jgi:SAM-dependent methyltransferase